MTLHLTLTRFWYDAIATGGKRVELRAMSSHWNRMIWDRRDRITSVRLARAYDKGRPAMLWSVACIDIGPYPSLGGRFEVEFNLQCARLHMDPNDNYYRIWLGGRIDD